MQAQQVTDKALKGASKIELRNPQRGKYFRIISEVWIDRESLAEMLKAKGLAKDYAIKVGYIYYSTANQVFVS